MKRTVVSKAFAVVLLVAMLSVAAACGGGSSPAGSSSGGSSPAPSASGSSQGAPAPVDLNFAIGATGGSNYPIGVAITQILNDADIPGLGSVMTQPGGGAANIEGVHNNLIQMGMVYSSMVYDGMQGNPPFKEKAVNAVPLFSLHPYSLTLLAPANSDIHSLADLKGKRLNVGPNGFSTAVIGPNLLKLYGFQEGDVTIMNLGVTDAVEQLKDGHLDALFYAPTDWFGAYIELAQSMDLRNVQIDPGVLKQMHDSNPGWVERQWPLNDQIYRGLKPVTTLAQANVIIANPTVVSEDLAYHIVKTIHENFDKIQTLEKSLELLEPKDLASYPGGEFHPGALKYFREQGWVQ